MGGCEGRCDACQSGRLVMGGFDVGSSVVVVFVGVAVVIWAGWLIVVRGGVIVWWHRVGVDVLLRVWAVPVTGSRETMCVGMGWYCGWG